MENLSDEKLIQLYRQEQLPLYFSLLYERYHKKILRKCRLLLKDEAYAADITQDIFVKLLDKIHSFQGKSKFSTWLYSVTYHYCLDQVRYLQVERVLYEDVDWQNLATKTVDYLWYFNEDLSQQFEWSWHQLGPDDQQMLLMKYIEGRSMLEMSRLLRRSVPSIKMRLKRSRDKFRGHYQDSYRLDLPQVASASARKLFEDA